MLLLFSFYNLSFLQFIDALSDYPTIVLSFKPFGFMFMFVNGLFWPVLSCVSAIFDA